MDFLSPSRVRTACKGVAVRFLLTMMISLLITACSAMHDPFATRAAPLCTADTPWIDTDKAVHFFGTAFIGGVVSAYTSSFWAGLGAGIAVGAAREFWKIYIGSQCELSSSTLDVLGSLLGASLGAR